MLYAYTLDEQERAVNEPLVLETIAIQTGCTATTEAGSSIIKLNKRGYYKIDASAIVHISEAESTSNVISLTMFVDGVAYPGAIAVDTVADTSKERTLNISAIVPVNCCDTCCKVVSFVNDSIAAIYSDYSVSVTKLC